MFYKLFKNQHFDFSHASRQHDINLNKMKTIITGLEDLTVLHRRYKLTLTLDNYINGDIEHTAFKLLQTIGLNNLQNMVNDFLYPIFSEKGLSPVDSIIR